MTAPSSTRHPDRRRFLTTSAATAGAAALGTPGLAAAQDIRPLADCHVHLFNASDLPVGTFLRYVVIPSMAPGTPDWAAALADLFANVIKPLAVSVEREADPPFLSFGLEPSPVGFGRAVAEYIRERSRPDASTRFDPELEASYRSLSALVAEDSVGVFDPRPFQNPYASQDPGERKAVTDLTADSFAAAARKAEVGDDDAPVDLGDLLVVRRLGPDVAARQMLAQPPANLPAVVAGPRKAVRMVGWAYLMCRSRESHLKRYLRDYATRDRKPRMILNHLVDYDSWLDDGPLQSSAHLAQLDLLHRIGQRYRREVEVLTFAGYCPLKHALETARGQPTTFEALKSRFGRQVSGFKLYPPMGFRPWGNAELTDAQFARPRGGAEVVLDQWRRAGGRPGALGAAIDAALESFFSWCVAEDVPIMAHAGPGNEAAEDFGERANPVFWEAARSRFPSLRLSLGHLINTAQPFIRRITPEVDVGEYDPASDAFVWSLDAPPRLFSPLNGQPSNIYGDLGYMPELIGRPDLARAFFVALKRHFEPVDPGLRRILFGSDWIMMGIEAADEDYVPSLVQGMIDAGYSPEERENVLWANGRRFMRLAP